MSTLTLRNTKGAALTNAEMDANFTNLNADKLELGQAQSGGTANGVAYLNGSKVLTTGSALTFDGTNLSVGGFANFSTSNLTCRISSNSTAGYLGDNSIGNGTGFGFNSPSAYLYFQTYGSEQMRLTSTGLGIGTSSPSYKLDVNGIARATDVIGTSTLRVTSGAAAVHWISSVNGLAGSGSTTDAAFGAYGSFNWYPNNGTTLAMKLDSSGNLGLGVTPSAWSLGKAIESASLGNAYFVVGNENYLTSNAYYNSGWKYGRSSVGAANYLINANSHIWNVAPSGTAGNPITFTQAMTLDASGQLGVGTAPDAMLRVLSSTGASLRIGYNGTSVNYYDAGTQIFRSGNGGSERMRIDSSGNVGIGTSSPGGLLEVGTGSYAAGGSRLQVNYTTDGSGPLAPAYAGLNLAGSSSVRLLFGTYGAPAYGAYLQASNTGTGFPIILNPAGGNVGIGTSNPSSTLTVVGNNLLNGQSVAATTSIITCAVGQRALSITDNNNYTLDIGQGSSGSVALIKGTVGSALALGANNAESMRIDTSGNLLVGTTSVSGKFNVVAASAPGGGNYTAYLRNTWATDAGAPGLYIAKYDNNSTTSQILVKFSINNESAGQGQINGNGASQAAFGSFSDARLKENIVDLPPQLKNICALRPVEFDYIESEGGGHQVSFIAQEFENVYPDAIGERADGMKTLTGWGKTEARLVKAIQELKAELDAIKAELATLKGN